MRSTIAVLLSLALPLVSAAPAAASGACCGVVLSPDGSQKRLTGAVFGTLARSTEDFGASGKYVFDQSAVSAKLGFPIYKRLGGGVLLGRVLRSSLRNDRGERIGSAGLMYGLQLGGPVWTWEEQELDVSLAGSWSRASSSLRGKRQDGPDASIDQRVKVDELQASLITSKCFGPLDLSLGLRSFHGETRVTDEAGTGGGLTGHRDGHVAGLAGARVHLGSEDRSLALEAGLGAVRTFSLGLVFAF